MKTIDEIVTKLSKIKTYQVQQQVLREWAEEIIDECAIVADEWRSDTPEFTKKYIEIVKQQL